MDKLVSSTKTFHFNDSINDVVVPVGTVRLPEWAANTLLYESAVKSGDITFLGDPASAGEDAKKDPANTGTKGAAK